MRLHPLPAPAVFAMAALLALAACGGGAPAPTEPPTARGPALVPARAGDLVAYATDRLRQRTNGTLPPGIAAATGGQPADAAALSSTTPTGTLVQEAGVDEDDLLKQRDGTVLSLFGHQLRRHRLDAGGLTAVDDLSVDPGADDLYLDRQGLYLQEDGARAVVLAQSWQLDQWQGGCGAEVCAQLALIHYVPTTPKVHLHPVTLGPAMARQDKITIDGRLVGSRRVGQQLVVVTVHVPALAYDALPATATTEERAAVLDQLRAEDLLPRVKIGSAAPTVLVTETECHLQPGNASPAVEITTVTVFDLSSPALSRQSRCFVGGTEGMYMSSGSLVLATTRTRYTDGADGFVYPASMSTDVHRFTLEGGIAQYRASGSVDGHLGWDPERKSHRFSEHAGVLRVLSYTGSLGWVDAPATGKPASPATLTVLREAGGELQTVGKLPNAQRPAPIGKPGEQVYAVRFLGDRGYVVTFRQVDPLYVLDLSDAADPRVAGVLEVPGFSQDLFDAGDGWLLGVGRDADANGFITAVAVSLFDVRDPTAPKRQQLVLLGNAGSSTALDHSPHGIGLRRSGVLTQAALPVAMPVEGVQRRTVQRIEVDASTGTLTLKPAIVTDSDPSAWPAVWRDRAQLVDAQVLHLDSEGGLALHDW